MFYAVVYLERRATKASVRLPCGRKISPADYVVDLALRKCGCRSSWQGSKVGESYDSFSSDIRRPRSRRYIRAPSASTLRPSGIACQIHIEQAPFVVRCERVPPNHRARRRGRVRPLGCYEYPIWRREAWCRRSIDSCVTRVSSWNQVMAVPASCADRPPVLRDGA